MISRNEGLKLAVISLINAIPGIINVLVISLLFFLLFGILGVNYFKGAFFYCHKDNVVEELSDIIEVSQDCLNSGGEWHNRNQNFDSVADAMLTLFEMSTTEGWINIMWYGVDSRGIGNEPKRDAKVLWVLFFLAFIVFGSLFMMNLFVGVVINTFNQEKDNLGKNALLSSDQKEWV
jgi:hypothetical protein